MTQDRWVIRKRLVVVACVIGLGLGAAFVIRALTATPAPAARDATPKLDAPVVASSVPAAAPPAASATADAAAREASWREAREATIRVQQRLRAEQQARKAAQLEETKDERCVGGQRMKRVENGWVQAGNC